MKARHARRIRAGIEHANANRIPFLENGHVPALTVRAYFIRMEQLIKRDQLAFRRRRPFIQSH